MGTGDQTDGVWRGSDRRCVCVEGIRYRGIQSGRAVDGQEHAHSLARQEQCWGKGRRAVTSNLKPLLLPSPCQGNQGGQQPTAQRMAGPADCSELAIAGEQDGGTVVVVIVAHQRYVKPWCSLRCHVTGSGGVCMGSLPCRLVVRRLMQIANRTFSSSLGQPTSHRDDAAQTL